MPSAMYILFLGPLVINVFLALLKYKQQKYVLK